MPSSRLRASQSPLLRQFLRPLLPRTTLGTRRVWGRCCLLEYYLEDVHLCSAIARAKSGSSAPHEPHHRLQASTPSLTPKSMKSQSDYVGHGHQTPHRQPAIPRRHPDPPSRANHIALRDNITPIRRRAQLLQRVHLTLGTKRDAYLVDSTSRATTSRPTWCACRWSTCICTALPPRTSSSTTP